ncbi:FAD-dependent oxidoreductase, partial [Flavitalea sp.]|nr:FAD-dependent oxidoreductase [Flavitalea sp.]
MSKLERRDFIKKTMMGGMGVTLLNGNALANITPQTNETAPSPNKGKYGPSKKIIVGGAGLAGLCCAYELMKKGHDVTVLEASGRHGGHVFTVHDGLSDGLYGDFGQEHIVKPGYKLYFEYAKEL